MILIVTIIHYKIALFRAPALAAAHGVKPETATTVPQLVFVVRPENRPRCIYTYKYDNIAYNV